MLFRSLVHAIYEHIRSEQQAENDNAPADPRFTPDADAEPRDI